MSFDYILTQIVTDTFQKEVGKFQVREQEPKGMHMRFRIATRPDEEGYRHRELLIYASMNYVGVYERETWNVIPSEGLDDEEGIKPGFDYTKGSSAWVLLGYHDSGWREVVQRFFTDRKNELDMISSGDTWFKKVDVRAFTLPES